MRWAGGRLLWLFHRIAGQYVQSWGSAMGVAVEAFRLCNPVLCAKIKKNVGTALFEIPFSFRKCFIGAFS